MEVLPFLFQCFQKRLGLILLLAVATTVQSQTIDSASWISVRTAGIELFSTGSVQEAQRLLRTLQEARSFFAQLGLQDTDPERPVRVYAFQSSAEYSTVRLSRGTFGHCIRGRHSDYIVLEDIQLQHRRAALHELAHVVFSRAGYRLPVWLNEGLADVYSTFSVTEGRGTIGGLLPARREALEREPWLNLADLLTLTNEQRLYQEGKEVPIFYGESWALTHMLMFSPNYAPAFPTFLHAVANGQTATVALGNIYAITQVELAADLHRYWSKAFATPGTHKILPVTHLEPTVVSLSSLQSLLALAELLSATPSTRVKAEHLLQSLREQHPNDPDFGELLARVGSARAHTADERAAMIPNLQH